MLGAILGAVAGPLIGGLMNKKAKKDERQANVEDTLLQLPRLRQSAEDAGFNPLTALLSGAAGGFNNISSGVAPLASTEVITNTIKDVSDVVSGRKALEEQNAKLQNDLLKIEKDKARGVRPIAAPNADPYSAPPDNRPARVAPSINVPSMPRLGPGANPPILPNQVHVREDYTTSIGETVPVPMGPDLDEVLTGVAIEAAGVGKDAARKLKTALDTKSLDPDSRLGKLVDGLPNPTDTAPAYVPPPEPINKDGRLPAGVEAPDGWATWSDDRKTAWLVRWGHVAPKIRPF